MAGKKPAKSKAGKKKLGKSSMKRTKGGLSIAINPINPNTFTGTGSTNADCVQGPGTAYKEQKGTQF